VTSEPPRTLTDPVGVATDIVHRAEPLLDRSFIEEVVVGVAGGRA